MHKKLKFLIWAALAVFVGAIRLSPVSAIGTFAVSPMNQIITLVPGETYVGNFNIINPGDNIYDFYYEIRIEPFSVGEDNSDISLVANGDYNQIVDWIELSETEGFISPNDNKEIRFTINVPENAAAGGQYASIVVSSGEYRVDNTSVDLREVFEVSHLIYADIAGETMRKGAISDVEVPSFLFSGNISGKASIKNEGNVHSRAKYTLQVYPFFSSEEVYTNEEDPKTTFVMPDHTNYVSIEWPDTPSLGIFHVIYNVEFEGVESTVDKMVIVCPLWLLFILIACLFVVLFAIIFGGKKEKK